ncbi:OmpA family protein [Ornithobacterium rhinotracheale]|uniref:OmpA family protein n=1 Tax=Ornithobacterium rhinotracheale TaxID=28251 RepID=UPI00129CC24D|nr:OmpA family protein [Ornithobacterium rhinotracheale]MRI63715.1 OmpA family protein [Ornithobacterium rhinotracheale]
MKKFNLALGLAATLFVGANSYAQDASNPWGITIGAHAVDFTSAGRGVFDGFFDTDDYEIVPPLSKLSVIRHLGGKFSADLTASIGEVSNKRMKVDDKLFVNAGLGLRYRLLGKADKSYWFDPYLRIGASYHHYDYTGINFGENETYTMGTGETVSGKFEGKENYLMAQGGAGINFWITDNFGINLASDYNFSPIGDNSDYINFFQHTAGVTFKFGKQDRDKDGIEDSKDQCPDTPGLAEFNGCPDTDGDGIPDNLDNCPNEAGPKENNGCPWKDTDGDGLNDNVDQCPNQAGPRENNGCPWPDTDGDGFTDNVDKCPNEAGVAPDGCPVAEEVIIAEKVERINVDFTVEFATNKADIRPSSDAKIDQKAQEIKDLLAAYPDLKLNIDGYTDNTGRAAYNLKLSERRAASVVKALEQRGIPAGVLSARGFGQENPKCTNDTPEGRQCNRRVAVSVKSLH